MHTHTATPTSAPTSAPTPGAEINIALAPSRFAQLFDDHVPEGWYTPFSSLSDVSRALHNADRGTVWVASDNDGKPLGFLIHNPDGYIHTMFVFTNPKGDVVPDLFSIMMKRVPKCVRLIDGKHTVFFQQIKGYNEDMIQFYKSAAKNAAVQAWVYHR